MVRIDFNRLRFLVIDDNAHMRRILRTLLHGFGTREVYEAGRAVVCAVNKWDLLNGHTPEQIHRVAQQRLRFVPDVQVCLTVATQGRGIAKLI